MSRRRPHSARTPACARTLVPRPAQSAPSLPEYGSAELCTIAKVGGTIAIRGIRDDPPSDGVSDDGDRSRNPDVERVLSRSCAMRARSSTGPPSGAIGANQELNHPAAGILPA